MSNITIAIYRYFQKHRGLFYTILVVSSLLFVALGTRLSYEEDISKLLPSNEIGSSEQLVFNNLKVKDKIFVLFVSKSDSTTLDEITETCDAFSDSLLAKDKDSIINDITYNIPEEFLIDGIAYLYDNLPLYLDSTDYTAMDTIFTKSHIERQMSDNYEELLSASGMYSYDIIRQDPAGLRYALKSKGKNISESMGGSYKIINKHFFTPDSTVAVAFITPNFKAFDSKTGIRLTENIEAEIKAMNKIHPEIEILFHGAPIQSVFNSRQIKTDLMMTMGLSLLFVCIIIAICFRNKSTLPFLLSPVIYGTFFALACMYLTQGTMSLMAVGIGAIVLGVALSYCLHVLTHYKYLSDPEQVLRDQTRPVILGSLTTIGAFMGLLFTESALLRDFGLFASLAMVGTTIFCLIFLPQFLNPEKNRKSEKVFRWLEHINAYPLDKQKWLIITLVIISVICTIYSQWVCFDTNLKNIGYTNPNVARSSQILSDKTAHGKLSTYFSVTSDNLDSALVYNERLGMR
ncbi:MAG TPA: MMPL family transporter, partial [Candidatus Enterocola sp.]|nr:MMPL family transporter [Candidatus Enterocola sp.]